MAVGLQMSVREVVNKGWGILILNINRNQLDIGDAGDAGEDHLTETAYSPLHSEY